MRFCTPTWGAASPTPAASYMVSTIVSTNRASWPSMSVTSFAFCFSTGSPKTRTGYVDISVRLPVGLFVSRAELAEHAREVDRGVGGGLARRVRDRGERARVREGSEPSVQVPAHR